MPTTDIHQHLFPEALLDALRRRRHPPRLNGSKLELDGREPIEMNTDAHDVDARLVLLDRCEIDIALVSLPPSLGIDDLPGEDATELLEAYERGILEVSLATGRRLVPLGASASADGFAGACVGAPALMDLDAIAPLLDELERRGALLFVHPGSAASPPGAPEWWSPVVLQTAQMQAAYGAWLAEGAERWPTLTVVFALLAGGGPFQLERLRSRGVGGREALLESVYFETSSYGRRALELCLATFGVGQLLFGSDAPAFDPASALDAVRGFGDAVVDALCNQNPSRLLP